MSTADTAVRTLEELTAEERKLIDLIRQMGYGEIYLQNEIEQSKYNFEYSTPETLFNLFDLYSKEVENCTNHGLVLPAYDYVLKCSHTFNLLDARGVISKDERTNFINRIRRMAEKTAKLYYNQRAEMGFPLLKRDLSAKTM